MRLGAFVSLEDISDALPPYQEEVVSIEMDPMMMGLVSWETREKMSLTSRSVTPRAKQ